MLFNNAGVFHPKSIPDCTEEEWDETIDSSLKGAFLMSKYVLPSMIAQGSGSIIHTSSGWGILADTKRQRTARQGWTGGDGKGHGN